MTEARRLRNQQLRSAGLCRDCRKPSDGKLRCSHCQRLKSLPSLPAWMAAKRRMRDYLSGEQGDRRHNGKATRGLDWALAVHLT